MVTKKLISLVLFTLFLAQIYGATSVQVIYPNNLILISPTDTSADINVQIDTNGITEGYIDLFLCNDVDCSQKYLIAPDLNINQDEYNWDCNASFFCHYDWNLSVPRITTDLNDDNLIYYLPMGDWYEERDGAYVIRNLAQGKREYESRVETGASSINIIEGIFDSNAQKFLSNSSTSGAGYKLEPRNDVNFSISMWVDTFETVDSWLMAKYLVADAGFFFGLDRSAGEGRVQFVAQKKDNSGLGNYHTCIGNATVQWHHIGVTYNTDTNQLCLYCDNVSSCSAYAGGVRNAITPNLTLGGFDESTIWLAGTYDNAFQNVKYYNSVRTPNEMALDRNGTFFDINGWANSQWRIHAEFDPVNDINEWDDASIQDPANKCLSISSAEAKNGDYLYNATGAGTEDCWNDVPIPLGRIGNYHVYVHWSAHSNRATDTPYSIFHNGVINLPNTWYRIIAVADNVDEDGGADTDATTIDVEQEDGVFDNSQGESTSSNWLYLGTYIYNSASDFNVIITDGGDEFSIIDAVEFRYMGISDDSDANFVIGESLPIINYDINVIVYEAGTSNHLTSVILDFNIDSRDVNGNSPFDLNFDSGHYDVNISKSGYDDNTNYVFIADGDKAITIYLTETYIPPTHQPPHRYFSPTELKEIDSNRYLSSADYRDVDENVYYSRFDLRGQDKTAIKHDTQQTIGLYLSFAIIIAVVIFISIKYLNKRRLG